MPDSLFARRPTPARNDRLHMRYAARRAASWQYEGRVRTFRTRPFSQPLLLLLRRPGISQADGTVEDRLAGARVDRVDAKVPLPLELNPLASLGCGQARLQLAVRSDVTSDSGFKLVL